MRKIRCMTSTTQPPTAVGIIGLGAMGLGMAQSLRRAGLEPSVFDIRADIAARFAEQGGTACSSIKELGSRCNIVISVVVNAEQTESVLWGPEGCVAAMRPGGVFVMC